MVKLGRSLGLPQLSYQVADMAATLRAAGCVPASGAGTPGGETADGAARVADAGTETPLLLARGLRYTYPGNDAPTLHGLDFTLPAGCITALMGQNGAGKSTLLNILGGLEHADAGELLLDGRTFHAEPGVVGYLRQDPDLMLLAETVREELSWKNKALTPDELDALLRQLHLSEYGDDFPLALSRGQRVRVVLGAMLARKPRLLLLDEPTSGQDEQSLREIITLLRAFRAQGGSMLLCTHDWELATAVADEVLLLQAGQVMVHGPAAEVLGNPAYLQAAGLAVPPLLQLCEALGLPPQISVETLAAQLRQVAATHADAGAGAGTLHEGGAATTNAETQGGGAP